MKHVLFVLVFLLCCHAGMAQTAVTEAEAIAVSSNFMQRFFTGKSCRETDVSHVSHLERDGRTLLYEVCFRNGCSVLVPGVKSVMPVLGYNNSGDGLTMLQDSGGSGMSHFVEKYASAIGRMTDNCTVVKQWEILSDEAPSQSRGGKIYGPYITTRWKQTSSNDGQPDAYNYYVAKKCDRENRCAAGCVPVAMAQIMNYWKYLGVHVRI